MSAPFFHFRQFSITQDKAAMKISTDGVLLGAVCEFNYHNKILDIGTGTGLISLMAAQKSNAEISAVEIDQDAYFQAKENVEKSEVENMTEIGEVAYFKEDKLEGYITKEEAKVLNLLGGKMKNSIISTSINNSNVAFEIASSKVKIDCHKENEFYTVNIDVKISAYLSEIEEKVDTNSISNISMLEVVLKNKVNDMIDSYLYNITKVYKSDLSGFGEILFKKFGNKFKKEDEDYLNRLIFKVIVEASLENEGSELILR